MENVLTINDQSEEFYFAEMIKDFGIGS